MALIFQPEVSALESQVVALQAQLAAAQQRITLLNETEQLAGGTLEALKGAIAKVTALAPDAIASLKSAVLNLFQGSDDPNDGGNQQVFPEPKPSDDGEVEVAIAVNSEPLTGQSTEFSSPFACQLEDCPSTALTGQLYELSSPWIAMSNDAHIISMSPVRSLEESCLAADTPTLEAEMPYVELIPVNHRVSYQRRQDGEIICCYVGSNNKNRLKDWGSWLCNQHSVGSGFELRIALRMTAFKHEIKIWGMSLKQIERLAETDTSRTPPSKYHLASFPVAEKLLTPEIESTAEVSESLATVAELEQVPSPDPLMVQVGDKVEITSDRHGAELVGLTGIVTAATKSGSAVEVNNTLKYFCADELATIEKPVSLEPTEEELIAITSIQPPIYNLNPIGRGGAAANWKARQASGIGVNLKDCGTGGITTLEEWRQIEAEQKAQKAITVLEEQDIQEGDWVELLINGDHYQVDSVTSEGINLVTDDGNACVEADEVKLLFRAPADWKPF